MKAKLPGAGDDKVDILHLVSRYLVDGENGPWLLILDNADDATVLLNPSTNDPRGDAVSVQRRLLDFVPRVHHGSVIITTRDQSCALKLTGHRGTPIEVLAMTLDESANLLRIFLPHVHKDEASELALELENVPLAISQAGAYMKEVPRISIPKYLAKFRRSKEDQVALLNKNQGDLRRDPAVPNAVITSWELSFNQIRQTSPDSAELLSLMCYFNRQAIPLILLQCDTDEFSFEENINVLLGFSLIRAEIGEDIFEMHSLVKIAMEHWLRSEGYEQSWKERAIERVAQKFPEGSDQKQKWSVCEVLMSHADEVLLYTANSKVSELSRALILNRTGWYIMERKGDYVRAGERSNQVLQIRRKYFDSNSDEVLHALSLLAVAEHGLNKLGEAVDLQELILKRNLKKYGPDDRNSLIAMHNLAMSYTDSGKYEKAEELMERVVEATGRLFGPDNGNTLDAQTLLVNIYLFLGKAEEAEKLGTKLWEVIPRRYGFEHVITIQLMSDLSYAYLHLNQLEKAEDKIAQAITFFSKVVGPISWDTLGARTTLANIYHWQGKLDQAKDICLSCLELGQQLQGSLFVKMARLRCSHLLGQIFQDQGNLTDALKLLTDTAESSRELQGDHHPETLIYMSALAKCYYAKGDSDHAIRLMTAVLEKRRKVLPANHQDTMQSAEWLADWKGGEEGIEGREIEEEESEEWETAEEVIEEDGMEEEVEVNGGGESEQDENKDEVAENKESEKDDAMSNRLAEFHISSPASRDS